MDIEHLKTKTLLNKENYGKIQKIMFDISFHFLRAIDEKLSIELAVTSNKFKCKMMESTCQSHTVFNFVNSG